MPHRPPPPSSPLDIEPDFGVDVRRPSPGIAVIDVGGEIDLLTAPTLLEAARAELAAGCATLVLDLAGVSFCSVRGIATLVEITGDLARQHPAVLRIAHPSKAVCRVADLTRTREIIEGGPTRYTAKAMTRRRSRRATPPLRSAT